MDVKTLAKRRTGSSAGYKSDCLDARERSDEIDQDPPKRYERVPQFDRRFARGDDFAGDAWRDRWTGKIEYGAVGVDRNLSA